MGSPGHAATVMAIVLLAVWLGLLVFATQKAGELRID